MLNLISPQGSNFLKDWPDQNTVNCDLIDNYAGPCLASHALESYVPVLEASVTNPILGVSSTVMGKYYRIFDQVWFWGEWRYGTSANIGDGVYQVSLPFRAKTNLQTGTAYSTPIPIGSGMLYDQSLDTGSQPVVTCLGGPDYANFLIRMNSGAGSRAVTHVAPLTWNGAPGPGDGMMFSGMYTREP